MFLYTIPLLLFSNLFVSITNAEETPPGKIETRRFHRGHDNCVCFPGGPGDQLPIPELMNDKLHGTERIVVYLYRTGNQIVAHKPSPDKQALIPNIPYTLEDTIKVVTTDTISSLFDNNLFNVRPEGVPYNQAAPIGFDFGPIVTGSPEQSFTEFTPFSSKLKLRPYRGQPQQPYTSWYPTQQQFDITGTYPDQQEVRPDNGQPHPNYIKLNFPSQHNPAGPGYSIGPNGEYIPTVINTWEPNDKKYFNPTSQPHILHKVESKARWLKPFSTFNNWFNKQMQMFQNPKLPQDIRAINFDVFRILVQKTLLQNKIRVDATGRVVDENGAPINLDNLELRPILIGNSVKFPAFQGNQKLLLPQNLPYLDAILIILTYPPKILGVIPLGKTYVSCQKQIHQLFNIPSIKHYQTPFGLKSMLSNIKNHSFKINPIVKLPLYGDSNNIHWNPAISTDWRRSEDGVQKETPPSNNTVNLDQAQKSTQSALHILDKIKTKLSKTLKTRQSPGLLKSEVTQGRTSELTELPKTQKQSSELNTSERSSDPNSDSQSKNTLTRRAYYNNYNPPYSSLVPGYYESAENSLIPKSFDSNTLKLIAHPINSYYMAPSISNNPPVVEPISISPGLSVSPLYDMLKFTTNNHNFRPHRNNKWNFSNFPRIFSPDNKGSASTNWQQQQINPHLVPSTSTTYHNINGFKLPIPYSQVNSLANGLNISPDEIFQWSNRRKDDKTTNPAIEISKSNNFGSTQSQGQVVSNSGDLQNDKSEGATRRFFPPLYQGVVNSLLRTVLQNLTPSENARRNSEETNVTDVNVSSNNPLSKPGAIEDDGPDFRIIGGSAATGSGSPLSNKGRSG